MSEVIGETPIRSLPGLGAWSLGVVAWRGRAIPVLNAGAFYADTCFVGDVRRMAIVEHDAAAIAIPGLDAREVQLLTDVSAADAPLTLGCATMWDAPLRVVDVPELVRCLQRQRERAGEPT